MKNKVRMLVHILLAASLMGCGVSNEVTAHAPAAIASVPVLADERPAQAPGRPAVPRPVVAPLAAVATARRPAGRPAASPAEAAPELAIGAPNRRIQSGRIIDEAGQPLVGATVLLKGTARGTSTDANGDYSLPVPLGTNTFVFAYTGYQEEVGQSRDGQPLTVTLLPIPGVAPAAYGQSERQAKPQPPKTHLRKAQN